MQPWPCSCELKRVTGQVSRQLTDSGLQVKSPVSGTGCRNQCPRFTVWRLRLKGQGVGGLPLKVSLGERRGESTVQVSAHSRRFGKGSRAAPGTLAKEPRVGRMQIDRERRRTGRRGGGRARRGPSQRPSALAAPRSPLPADLPPHAVAACPRRCLRSGSSWLSAACGSAQVSG